MKTKKIIILIWLTAVLTLAFSQTVLAQTPALGSGTAGEINTQNQAFLGQAGLGSFSLGALVALVIKTLLSLLGVIFVVLVIYAGFLWMTSAGNEENISKAKKIIIAATIGLAIVLSAYAITVFVLDKLLVGTGTAGTSGSVPGHAL